jgi:SagB-type dehydrogenase family enzyme
MKWSGALLVWLIAYALSGAGFAASALSIELPSPRVSGGISVAEALAQRRSIRSYSDAPLRLGELGQLLWAAQGITHRQGLRTAPSAGALYPLELYVVVGSVEGLGAGVYHYRPEGHLLTKVADGDRRKPLAGAALHQSWIREASVVIVLTAVFERTRRKYGPRAERYAHMEVGHAGQNLFLQAEALGLATVVVGAFDDEVVTAVLGLPAQARPMSLMPVGNKR